MLFPDNNHTASPYSRWTVSPQTAMKPAECRSYATVEHAAEQRGSYGGSASAHGLLFSAPDVQSCSFIILPKASMLE